LQFDIGEAVPLLLDNLAIANDQKGEPGDLPLCHGGVNVCINFVSGILRRRKRSKGQQTAPEL
jgi:hypothetical protein